MSCVFLARQLFASLRILHIQLTTEGRCDGGVNIAARHVHCQQPSGFFSFSHQILNFLRAPAVVVILTRHTLRPRRPAVTERLQRLFVAAAVAVPPASFWGQVKFA
jgi:hypothetical protein